MYSYVSPVAGCGSDVPFIEMTLTQPRKWDSNPEPFSYKYGTSLPNNKILDLSKCKANADDKILVNVTEKLKPDFRRVENIVGKCWLPAFSPFPTMFSEGVFSGS